jgi:hypothetical protein
MVKQYKQTGSPACNTKRNMSPEGMEERLATHLEHELDNGITNGVLGCEEGAESLKAKVVTCEVRSAREQL